VRVLASKTYFIAQFSIYLPFSKRETKNMKRTVTLLGLSLMLLATAAFAQRQMDDANERAVRITQGPNVTNITGESATMNWSTSSSGANHVRYREAGSNHDWQSAYHQGGGTNHSIQLTGLQPGKTYEWQILTRDGDLRMSGQFQTAGRHHGHGADVHGGSYPDGGGRDRDHDADDRGYGQGDRGYGQGGERVTLYRSSNSTGALHLYTISEGERNSNGFHAEGPAGYLMSSENPGLVALYRMTGRNGDTLLTTDPNERSRMQGGGYRENGIVGYVATSERPGTQPLHRMVNADGRVHFFTTSQSEVGRFQEQGWREEGITGYIWTQP
jgi:hypothetical protein